MNNPCIIIGNGPSLKSVPLDWLKQYPTLGGNGIYQLFEPTYYFYVDPDYNKFLGYVEEISAIKSQKFVYYKYAPLIRGATGINITHEPGFSYSPLSQVHAYFSVSTVMVQFAYWLGFDEVRLIGFDHRYTTPNGARGWHTAAEDTNHFKPDYYKQDDTWKAPRLDKLSDWFKMARGVFERDGRRIVNYTENSALEVIEHASIS